MSRARECERRSNRERAVVVVNKTGEVNITMLCLTQAHTFEATHKSVGAGRSEGVRQGQGLIMRIIRQGGFSQKNWRN